MLAERPSVRDDCRQRVAGYGVTQAAAGIARAFCSVTAGPEVKREASCPVGGNDVC
jgi:hypothetical protein